MASELYPLTFRANLHTALWGTESWEISGHRSSPSVVAEGPLAGRALDVLAAEYGSRLTGTKAPVAGVFPLLFKVIDAQRRLSVQVHPNEATRALTGGEPKTEMWYVLGGKGPIFAGLRPGTTPACIEEDVHTGRFEDALVRHDAREGLTLFIPGGLVHAIGEDVCVYEVQQSSNTTYRLYDWGRVGANGKPRPLHNDRRFLLNTFQKGVRHVAAGLADHGDDIMCDPAFEGFGFGLTAAQNKRVKSRFVHHRHVGIASFITLI